MPSDAVSDLLGCPYRDHFPASAPPLLTLLLHNATRRAWVEYYIPERKGNARAEKTGLQWRTLPFHHRAPCVPADNRPLCSPISECKDCLHVFILGNFKLLIPQEQTVQGSVCLRGKGRRRGEICSFKIIAQPGLFIPMGNARFLRLFFHLNNQYLSIYRSSTIR